MHKTKFMTDSLQFWLKHLLLVSSRLRSQSPCSVTPNTGNPSIRVAVSGKWAIFPVLRNPECQALLLWHESMVSVRLVAASSCLSFWAQHRPCISIIDLAWNLKLLNIPVVIFQYIIIHGRIHAIVAYVSIMRLMSSLSFLQWQTRWLILSVLASSFTPRPLEHREMQMSVSVLHLPFCLITWFKHLHRHSAPWGGWMMRSFYPMLIASLTPPITNHDKLIILLLYVI